MDPHRLERVTENIREELEEMINFELDDPRVGPCSVATVHISPDRRHAHVLLALKGTEAEQAQTLEAVQHAKQYLKQELTSRLQLFKTPELRFEASLPAKVAARAPQLLRRLKRNRAKE